MALPAAGWRAQIDNTNAGPINLVLPQVYSGTYIDVGSVTGDLVRLRLGTHEATFDAGLSDFVVTLRQFNVFGFLLVDSLDLLTTAPKIDHLLPRVEFRSLSPRRG